jgi:HAD superfamily hydrolase (TIGR01509 family)
MTAPALIFDCDGVLVDTEQTGHLQAFNLMWRELGVPWQWTPAQYAQKLSICGGKERLASLYHDADFRAAVPVTGSSTAWTATVTAWHQHKTRSYLALLEAGRIQVRPGVRRLAEQAADAGWRLAVASCGAEESVNAVVRLAMGPDLLTAFTVVTGNAVARKKPDPEVYLHTARELGVSPDRCIAVEDSRNGMLAALRAGMRCVVTPTRSSQDHVFEGAALVVTHLGDPDPDADVEPVAVQTDRALTHTRGHVTLDDLQRLLTDDTAASTPSASPAPMRQTGSGTAPLRTSVGPRLGRPIPVICQASGPEGPTWRGPGPRFTAEPVWAPQAVLFDCDGTLVDTEPCWTAGIEELFRRNGLPRSPVRKPEFIGRTAMEMAELIAAELADPGRADVLEKELLEHVIQILSTAEPMPGARAFLAAVSAAVPVAVVSNSPRAVLDIVLARTGFDALVDVTVAAEDTDDPKPAPAPYLLACRRFGLDPGLTPAVEDSPTGLTAARAAGAVTLGVPTLPDPAFGADWVVPSLADPALARWTRAWTGSDLSSTSHMTSASRVLTSAHAPAN